MLSEKGTERGRCLDEVWSCCHHLLPVGAAKEHETEIFEITTLKINVME